MSEPRTRGTVSEVGRLGREAYERHVRPKLLPEDDGKYVVIDVDTGEYEIDADDDTAAWVCPVPLPLPLDADSWLVLLVAAV